MSRIHIEVIGFGGRTPAPVLQLLERVVATSTSATSTSSKSSIECIRSPNFESACCRPPYRFFVGAGNANATNNDAPLTMMTIYCLPSSDTEYMASYSEDELQYARSILMKQVMMNGNTTNTKETKIVAMVYNPSDDVIDGLASSSSDVESLVQSIVGDAESGGGAAATTILRNLASRALQALAGLDTQFCEKYCLATTAATSDASDKAREGGGDVVIVVGGGGREHAIAVALAQSPRVRDVIVCPGNGGTEASTSSDKIRNAGPSYNQSNASILQLVGDTNAQMVVVGPEQPLVDGIVDMLTKELGPNCPLVFGPSQAASQLEASKAFSKDFLLEHKIPTAQYRNFTNIDEAIQYVELLDIDGGNRQVVKASGLAAGKGVLLPTTKAETIHAVREIMHDKAFGAAGDTCVIEQFLDGPEASCLAFCDGKTAKLMVAAQDHKRALDGDAGLNTGGMGAYAPAPCITPALQAEIEAMCQKTVTEMANRGTPYVGVLYAGMLLTPDKGPHVLEFNCRFGDPETQVVLPLLETDLYEVFIACCTGTLGNIDVRFKQGQHAATVVCAAKGYPEKYPKGMAITGLDKVADGEDVFVYHAGTKLDLASTPGKPVTRCSGGRVLAVTGTGPSLASALQSSYRGVAKLDFVADDNRDQSLMHYRTDIARRAVEKKLRIGVLGSTRGTALIPVLEACASGKLHAEIVCVVSNKSQAPILEKGRALGSATCTTRFLSSKGLTREQYDAECTSVLVDAGVEFVLLVGYMRILSKPFTDYWMGRCVNVHPSLLPKHAGGMDLAVHQAVLDAGETETGCTIHQVTDEVDGGPIVVQKRVTVASSGETAESLKAKVQPLEGPAFIEAIQLYYERHQQQLAGGGPISYADAGVSIDTGNRFVDVIKPLCKATRRPGCDADLGGFGGLFDLAAAGYDCSTSSSADTVLIGATDGVGTKLRIAQTTDKHESVGIDLVAMCVNDLIVAGGEPLFFLDYFATSHLDVAQAAAVVKGIAEGCRQSNCGLVGGETAEMPSMYAPGDYDLAGFSVGAVPKDRILPSGVCAGDRLLGLPSTGIHSNGFSLVRKLIEKRGLTYESPCPWDDANNAVTIGDSLLTPTKIYVKSCLPLIKDGLVKGLSHITGGGLLENVPRSLPDNVCAEVSGHPPLPPVFRWLKEASGLDDHEMLRTFNCGIGMVLIVSADKVGTVKDKLAGGGDDVVFDLGVLRAGQNKEVIMQGALG